MALRNAPSDTSLLPSYQLRVDALRGLLPPHCPRFRFHIGAEAREVVDSFGMERASSRANFVRQLEGIRQRGSRPDDVSNYFFHKLIKKSMN